MPTSSTQTISESIFEIRYTPNSKILDYRGTWAELVSHLMELSEWNITGNRIDVFDKEMNRRAFVSFKNAGVVIKNTPTKNYFPEQGNKLLRFLFKQEPFGDPLWVGRIGVRSRFATAFNGGFNDLLRLYMERFLSLTSGAKDVFAAEITDIGGPVNLHTNQGKINSNSGPMQKDQLKQFFDVEDELPEVALYFDLDYWKEPKELVEGKDVMKIVKSYAEEIWDIHERVRTLIFG